MRATTQTTAIESYTLEMGRQIGRRKSYTQKQPNPSFSTKFNKPVRVLRSSKNNSRFSSSVGIRDDGLSNVVSYTIKMDAERMKFDQFEMVQLPGLYYRTRPTSTASPPHPSGQRQSLTTSVITLALSLCSRISPSRGGPALLKPFSPGSGNGYARISPLDVLPKVAAD